MSNRALAALAFLTAAAAAGETPNTSVYSSLDQKTCKTISTSNEDASSEQLCPAIAGFHLSVLDADSRESITVVAPDGTRQPLRFAEVVTSAFSSLGPRAEWRLKPGSPVPIALTVRLNASDDPAAPSHITSYLVISRIAAGHADTQPTCVVRFLKSSATALEEARRIADQAAVLPCLKP